MKMPKDVSFRVDPRTGCWNCTSHAAANHGYPTGYHNGQQTTLHRKLYMENTGRNLSSDEFVIHSCDNKMCINPAHLRMGTAADNANDAVIRNRIAHGERHHNAKLNSALAIHISRSNSPVAELADRCGVSSSTVYKIKRGEAWRRATGISARR